MKQLHRLLISLASLSLILALTSCQDELAEGERGLNSEAFYIRYNRYIANWLSQQEVEAFTEVTRKETELFTATDEEEKRRLQGSIEELKRKLEVYKFREGLGDFFAFGDPSEIPDDLVWENGMDEPDIGDPAAVKGGTFRYYWPNFPPTVRQFGSNSNNGIRSDLYDNIEVYLVNLHPVTQRLIPGIAQEWAVGPDNRTVFFRIHPDAKFNDGHPITAEDYLTWARLRLSDHVDSIFFKQVIRESIAQFKVYGPKLLSITLPEEKPFLAYECGGTLPPSPTHFYDDFGADFEERHQWVVAPTTAAYRMKPEDLVKGESLTLTRVDDWWLKDKKFYRYRYNADRIQYRVVRDISKAWELFRAGELDYFPITQPEYYYEKSEIPAVFNGYIERTTWYNQYPRIPWGLTLNTAEQPLDNDLVRRGIAYASNWEKVIDVVFRGDYSRLPGFTSGYKETNPEVRARPFSVSKARQAFAKAGYNREDQDGILMNEKGERLDIEITFSTSTSTTTKFMVILKEEARRAGLNLILDGREGTAFYTKVISKEHQLTFFGWGFTPPYPKYYQFFHSRNAYDEKGNRKAQTNNIFSYADDKMDELTEANQNARTLEEFAESAMEIQEIIAEKDLFIPGFTNEFSRVGTWRWVRWPDTPETRFAPPLSYIPLESYCYWIDPEMKEETLAAKRNGKSFPEVERVVEDYRSRKVKEEPEPKEEAEPVKEERLPALEEEEIIAE